MSESWKSLAGFREYVAHLKDDYRQEVRAYRRRVLFGDEQGVPEKKKNSEKDKKEGALLVVVGFLGELREFFDDVGEKLDKKRKTYENQKAFKEALPEVKAKVEKGIKEIRKILNNDSFDDKSFEWIRSFWLYMERTLGYYVESKNVNTLIQEWQKVAQQTSEKLIKQQQINWEDVKMEFIMIVDAYEKSEVIESTWRPRS